METLETSKSDYELERGKPLPTWNHAILQKRILFRVENRYEGKFSVLPELNLNVLGDKLVPDLAVFEGQDSFLAHDQQMATSLPLIAVEILSPSQNMADLTDKVELYLQAGVKSCWLVLPGIRSISVSTMLGDYQTFGRHEVLMDPVTGIELDLKTLFN